VNPRGAGDASYAERLTVPTCVEWPVTVSRAGCVLVCRLVPGDLAPTLGEVDGGAGEGHDDQNQQTRHGTVEDHQNAEGAEEDHRNTRGDSHHAAHHVSSEAPQVGQVTVITRAQGWRGSRGRPRTPVGVPEPQQGQRQVRRVLHRITRERIRVHRHTTRNGDPAIAHQSGRPIRVEASTHPDRLEGVLPNGHLDCRGRRFRTHRAGGGTVRVSARIHCPNDVNRAIVAEPVLLTGRHMRALSGMHLQCKRTGQQRQPEQTDGDPRANSGYRIFGRPYDHHVSSSFNAASRSSSSMARTT
jgi:hypothetical protein